MKKLIEKFWTIKHLLCRSIPLRRLKKKIPFWNISQLQLFVSFLSIALTIYIFHTTFSIQNSVLDLQKQNTINENSKLNATPTIRIMQHFNNTQNGEVRVSPTVIIKKNSDRIFIIKYYSVWGFLNNDQLLNTSWSWPSEFKTVGIENGIFQFPDIIIYNINYTDFDINHTNQSKENNLYLIYDIDTEDVENNLIYSFSATAKIDFAYSNGGLIESPGSFEPVILKLTKTN
ncbi:MAG: hypothetical protein OIN85_07510 [Candidatus Methanoperedens sp.]|nr:hypothetical protein [Candidatus Methanoperedens sp.]